MNSGFNIIYKKKFNSFIDNLNVTFKIIVFLVLSFSVFLTRDISGLLILIIALFIFSVIGKVNLKTYWTSLKFVLIFFPITYVFNLLIYLNSSQVWLDSLLLTVEISLRIYILIFVSSVLMLSSSEIELTNSLETLMSPLRKIHVPTGEIALIISIGLRYIPVLLIESRIILNAQATRGLDYKTDNFFKKIYALFNTMSPLLINSFYKSQEMSNAMRVRSYEVGKERTKYKEKTDIDIIDWLFLGYFAFMFVFIILFRIFV